MPADPEPLAIGRGRVLKEGTRVALLSYGTRLAECLKAAEELDARGLPATVADARFAKPLDAELVERLARGHEVLLTVEEGSVGGFGSFVQRHLLEAGLLDEGGLRLRSLVLPDRWLEQGTPAGQYAEAGLDARAIAAAAVRALGRPGRLGLAQGAA